MIRIPLQPRKSILQKASGILPDGVIKEKSIRQDRVNICTKIFLI